MAKTRKKRQSYTPQQRDEILAAATRDKLTAAQVKRKFGVTPVTYYSWRKKAGATRRRGGATVSRRGRVGGGGIGGELGNQLRAEVQTRVRQMLPDIVRSEVNSYLNSLFSSGSGRKRGQRV
jgi:transposase-like protein